MVKVLQGNCVTILDESDLFRDASDMACVVEEAKPVSRDVFVSQVEDFPLGDSAWEFSAQVFRGILIAYDVDADIHHFFR